MISIQYYSVGLDIMVEMRIYSISEDIDIYISDVICYYNLPFRKSMRTMRLTGDMRILHDYIL